MSKLQPRVPKVVMLSLRAAPWVVFGPITGLMSNRAISCYRNGEPVLGSLYIVANITTLMSLPLMTMRLLGHL